MMLFNVFPGPIQQNGLDPATSEIQKLQNHIKQLEYNVKAMATVSLAVDYAVNTNISERLYTNSSWFCLLGSWSKARASVQL